MRIAGSDYINLFKSFPLLPLEAETDADDAVKLLDWMKSRTQLSRSALAYQAVLEMLILDYDVRKLDEPDLPSAADMDEPPVAAHACTDYVEQEFDAEVAAIVAADTEGLGLINEIAEEIALPAQSRTRRKR